MTETTSQTTSVPPKLLLSDTWGSIGQPLPHISLKLIPPTHPSTEPTPCTSLTQGECVVKGPNVTLGYLNAPSANASSFTSDGYYRTGDIFRFDPATNLLYVVERSKELIKVRGFQVAPAELEGVLTSHADITDAAVVGVPDERSGEVPRAYVVLRTDTKTGEKAKLGIEEIKRFMSEQLARYKGLEGGVIFVDEIPKLPSGKILKRVIREWVEKEQKLTNGAKL